MELLEIINQPYEINQPSKAAKMKDSNSPLWGLSELALRLTRLLIDSNLLQFEIAKVVENSLSNLLEAIHNYQLKGHICPGASRSTALLAYCLCKLFTMEGRERLVLDWIFILYSVSNKQSKL